MRSDTNDKIHFTSSRTSLFYFNILSGSSVKLCSMLMIQNLNILIVDGRLEGFFFYDGALILLFLSLNQCLTFRRRLGGRLQSERPLVISSLLRGKICLLKLIA